MALANKKIDRIIVRATNWVGDALLMMPALESVRLNFPDAHITVMAKEWVAPVFTNHPCVDEVLSISSTNPSRAISGFWGAVSKVRSGNYDLAVLFQYAFGAALTAWLAGVPNRLGYNRDGRGLFLNPSIKFHPQPKGLHQTAIHSGLLSRAGFKIVDVKPKFYLAGGDEKNAQSLLAGLSMDGEFLLGLAPGAAFGPAKQWPWQRYAEAASKIIAKTHGKVLIFGSAKEADIGKKVKAELKDKAVDLTAQTSLSEAAALISKCSLFLTNDSGLMHVAAAVGTRLAAIFGCTDAVATGPVSGSAVVVSRKVECAPCFKRICPLKEHLCMDLVDVDAVVAAGMNLLKG